MPSTASTSNTQSPSTTTGTTWRAYRQRYWPTLYLLDKNGHVRYKRIGEGGYEQTEAVIQTLIGGTRSRDIRGELFHLSKYRLNS